MRQHKRNGSFPQSECHDPECSTCSDRHAAQLADRLGLNAERRGRTFADVARDAAPINGHAIARAVTDADRAWWAEATRESEVTDEEIAEWRAEREAWDLHPTLDDLTDEDREADRLYLEALERSESYAEWRSEMDERAIQEEIESRYTSPLDTGDSDDWYERDRRDEEWWMGRRGF
jgi:glutamate synthase domain-containing protein 2